MTNQTPSQETGNKSYLSEEEKQLAVKSARSNDLRLILGALFVVYGVIVTLVGFVDHSAHNAATNGMAVNLWTGLLMLLAGLLFLAWNFLRPIPASDILESAESSARQASTDRVDVE